MGSVRSDARSYPLVERMCITTNERSDCIRLRHLGKDDTILSECYMSPEDAYAFGQTLIATYDQVMDIH
jgi:hypothetical protein